MEHSTDTLNLALLSMQEDISYLVNVVKQLEELVVAMQSNPMFGMMLGK